MNELHGFEQASVSVDARKLKCPMPLLKLKQALNALAIGDSVHLVVTDRTALRDFQSFIGVTQHTMTITEHESEIHFYIVKG